MSVLHEVNLEALRHAKRNSNTNDPDPEASASGESMQPTTPFAAIGRIQHRIPAQARSISQSDGPQIHMATEQCRRLCVSTFSSEQAPAHSIGFTSSLAGEGKSFLAAMTARVLATEFCRPTTLLECNWTHPSLHRLFGISSQPGLAEWLKGECGIADIRHQVCDNLTVIPSGDGERDAARLLQQLSQQDRAHLLAQADELLIVELPSVLSTVYAPLAAHFVEALVVVVRAGVTPDTLLAETCSRLKGMPIQGVALNQAQSEIPQWIQQLL